MQHNISFYFYFVTTIFLNNLINVYYLILFHRSQKKDVYNDV